MRLNDHVYDFGKWLCLIALPAVNVFYAALDGAFGWGYTQTVGTVLAAAETLIGTVIGISTAEYNKFK